MQRFLSVDPLTRDYPFLTPYQYASNSPIENSDLDGLESISEIKVALDRKWRTQIQVKNNLDQIPRPKIGNWYSNYRAPPSYLGPQPVYSPAEKERKDAEFRAYLRNHGYNDDGSKPPLMRLAENKTFNKFAENIALPTLEIVSYAGGIGELKMATRFLGRKEFEGLAKTGFLDASKIRFSQNNIAATFKDGRDVQSLVDLLKSGQKIEIEPVRIVLKDYMHINKLV